MKQLNLKAYYPHIFAIILFVIIGYVYFSPVLEGKS